MKASNATFAKATGSQAPGDRSSDKPPTPTSADEPDFAPDFAPNIAKAFALSGPSARPDPATHAYRRDLADLALAGTVIAFHYAQPVDRRLVSSAVLRSAQGEDSPEIEQLEAGTRFAMLDDTLGWAWGYAGEDRRVGYLRSDSLGPL